MHQVCYDIRLNWRPLIIHPSPFFGIFPKDFVQEHITMKQRDQPIARRSNRIAQHAQAQHEQIQNTPYPYLAFGRFANQSWVVWPAEWQVPGLSLKKCPCIQSDQTLYSDDEDFLAIRSNPGLVQWLPLQAGPGYICKGRGAPLRIKEGRSRLQFSDSELDFFEPTIAIVTSQVFYYSKMWYLVTYRLVGVTLEERTEFKNYFGNQVTEILWTEETKLKFAHQVQETEKILQCAPSWIAVDEFKSEEFIKLKSFYCRMGPHVLSADKQRCAKLAAVMEALDYSS
jgi:hypothetical protein